MKKIITRTSLFLLISLTLTLITIIGLRWLCDDGKYFQIPKDVKYLFAGHSHIRLAINDSLMHHTLNISEEGEAYIYTYQKLKTYLKFNPQIEIVFLECSNNSLSEYYDSRSWNQHFVETKLTAFNLNVDMEDLKLLMSHEPLSTLGTFAVSAKKQLGFLTCKAQDYPAYTGWFKHRHYTNSDVDSLLKGPRPDTLNPTAYLPSSHAISYIKKIKALCEKEGVKLILFRSPVHLAWEYHLNEKMFCTSMRTEFRDLEFFDFGYFSLPDEQFRDLAHLNYRGSQTFSAHIDSLLSMGAGRIESRKQDYPGNEKACP